MATADIARAEPHGPGVRSGAPRAGRNIALQELSSNPSGLVRGLQLPQRYVAPSGGRPPPPRSLSSQASVRSAASSGTSLSSTSSASTTSMGVPVRKAIAAAPSMPPSRSYFQRPSESGIPHRNAISAPPPPIPGLSSGRTTEASNDRVLLAEFNRLPPLDIVLDVLVYFNDASNTWSVAEQSPLGMFQVINITPPQYVQNSKSVAAGFREANPVIDEGHFVASERKDNREKATKRGMYADHRRNGRWGNGRWGKKIRIDAEVLTPRVQWQGGWPTRSDRRVFRINSVSTRQDYFIDPPGLPKNWNGRRTAKRVKR